MPRREFLRSLGAAAGTIALAGCTRAAAPSRAVGPPGALPIHADNVPIDPGLPVERGATLRVFEWREYLYGDVVEGFVRRHAADGVDVRVESYATMAEAIARLREPDGDFDVVFPAIDALRGLVDARLLRPLSHELLPNVRNLWPFFRSGEGPFYDIGQRYTVPYTVFTTGIGWRRDLVRPIDAPDLLGNPYDAYWDRRYRGLVGIYDDYREAIAMALLRAGEDPNVASDAAVSRAVDDLIDLAAAVDVEVSAEGAYEELQTGRYALQQSWSGDLLSAKRVGASAQHDVGQIAYTWPQRGVVGCDLTAICARGRNPVLAHAFVDHLLDEGVAMANFAWNGYQPPVAAAVPDELLAASSPWRRIVPDHLRSTILSPEALDQGRFLVPLTSQVDARWRLGWQHFRAAA